MNFDTMDYGNETCDCDGLMFLNPSYVRRNKICQEMQNKAPFLRDPVSNISLGGRSGGGAGGGICTLMIGMDFLILFCSA